LLSFSYFWFGTVQFQTLSQVVPVQTAEHSQIAICTVSISVQTVPVQSAYTIVYHFAQFLYMFRSYLFTLTWQFVQFLSLLRSYLLSLFYTLTWQFAQFVSLLQTAAIFGLATLGLLDKDKVISTLFLINWKYEKNISLKVCLKRKNVFLYVEEILNRCAGSSPPPFWPSVQSGTCSTISPWSSHR
jgi:hypothetical protein